MKAILSGLCSALMIIFSASSAYAITTESYTDTFSDTRRGTLDAGNKQINSNSRGIKHISKHGRTRTGTWTQKGTMTTNETIGNQGRVLGVSRTGSVTNSKHITKSSSHIKLNRGSR